MTDLYDRHAMALFVVVCFVTSPTLFGSLSAAPAQDHPGRKVLGIMPVFDSSGEEYGQQFAQNLTAMEFHKLDGAPFDVVLLNPGGLYNPLIPESLVDYAQSAEVDTVLIMSFLQTTKPQKGDYTLNVQAQLMDVATGKVGDADAGLHRKSIRLGSRKSCKHRSRRQSAGVQPFRRRTQRLRHHEQRRQQSV